MATKPITPLSDAPVQNWILDQTVMPTDMNNIGLFISNCEAAINSINAAFDSLLAYAGGSLTGALKGAPIKALTTSGTVTLTTDSNIFSVTGTGPVTSVTGWSQGIAFIIWGSALTLTNGSNLILKGGSRVVTAGDVSIFNFNGSTATELVYMPSVGWAGQFLALTGGSMSGAINETAVTMASATTMAIGAAAGNVVNVTGTNTISGFDTVQAGTRRTLRFGSALTITYNATSLILSGSKDLSISAGDVMEFVSLGSGNWACTNYQPVSGSTTPITFNNFSNFKAKVTSNTGGTITADNNPFTGSGSINLTLNATTVGANGIDSGSLAANTWYYRFVIFGSAGTACLLSLSPTSPTLPIGYTQFVFCGSWRTDSSGNLYRLIQSGRKIQYSLITSTNTVAYPTMASGASGSFTAGGLTAVSVSSFVPPTASLIELLLSNQYNSATQAVASPTNLTGAYTSTTPPPIFVDGNTGSYSSTWILLESTNVYYASNNAAGRLQCMGWEENL